ncbi:ABC transporter ATP-binding protein [Rhodospirillum sp. A1_3_36]|uniref:ABC transporter ATP-binding protein n=1 Tax=Rhodospirillum sp. A1_3_36 TaxID=3391666 RepID=UPI0039A73304
MPTHPAIRVEQLTKVFPNRKRGQVVAVDGVTLWAERNSTVGLLGGNGAGKTTTISMILGLLTPTSGRIEVLGVDMVAARHKALPFLNFSSPYVDLPHRLTVRENLMVYALLYGLADPKARIATLTAELRIDHLMNRPSGKLSAGQKTRVALAKALLNDPRVLLLDEPTASLDPDTGDWVRTYLENWRRNRGATLFLASHNMAEVERLCDTVFIMGEGRVRDQGAPRDLLDRHGRANLEEVFLKIAREGRDPDLETPP